MMTRTQPGTAAQRRKELIDGMVELHLQKERLTDIMLKEMASHPRNEATRTESDKIIETLSTVIEAIGDGYDTIDMILKDALTHAGIARWQAEGGE